MDLDINEFEEQRSTKNRRSNAKFLAALVAHHGEPSFTPEPPLFEIKALPPIPNKAMAHAVEIAFPRMIPGTIELIQRIVVRKYGFTKNDLMAERRTAKIVRARQISMYLAKELTTRSLPDIGRRTGGRDHTTVLHAVRKIQGLLATDPQLAGEIEELTAEIKAYETDANSFGFAPHQTTGPTAADPSPASLGSP